MNQMQQMLQQAQRMQRELQKAQAALAEKEFSVSKGGMVEVIVMGNHVVKEIKIDPEALDADNVDLLQETIVLALNEANEQVDKENAEIEERITGRGGLF